MTYEKRFYREWAGDTGLVSFNIIVKETDLQIFARTDLSKIAKASIKKYRGDIEQYICDVPSFKTSLSSVKELNKKRVPDIIRKMIIESAKASVGPMATVAGAISEFVGNDLLRYSDEVIIENGGDIFINSKTKRVIGIYAGMTSDFSNKIGIEIESENMPVGICTSSGKVGHSLSFGNSDAVIVKSKSTLLADGVATMLGNYLKNANQIQEVLNMGISINGILGIVLIINNKIGILGDIKLVKMT